MSVPSTEGVETPEAEEGVVLQNLGADAAFGALMDTLVADEAGGTEGDAAPAAGSEAGSPAADGDGAAAGTGTAGAATPAGAGTPAAADAGAGTATPVPAGDPAGGGAGDGGSPDGGRPTTWTQSAAELSPRIDELAVKFEESVTAAYQAEALDIMREEHSKYFEAIEKPARMLVGTTVPALNGQGEEVLRDTNDAREWQEGVKHILVEELRGRANQALDENKDFLATIHSSIELFQKNNDLIPGTRDFDVDLANRFASFAKPYELRVDGKLSGYSIPVQPIIDQLRDALVKERATGAPSPKAPPAAAAPAAPVEPPQAGIPSKAGASADSAEDFSTLFGTLGLPNLKI